MFSLEDIQELQAKFYIDDGRPMFTPTALPVDKTGCVAVFLSGNRRRHISLKTLIKLLEEPA